MLKSEFFKAFSCTQSPSFQDKKMPNMQDIMLNINITRISSHFTQKYRQFLSVRKTIKKNLLCENSMEILYFVSGHKSGKIVWIHQKKNIRKESGQLKKNLSIFLYRSLVRHAILNLNLKLINSGTTVATTIVCYSGRYRPGPP